MFIVSDSRRTMASSGVPAARGGMDLGSKTGALTHSYALTSNEKEGIPLGSSSRSAQPPTSTHLQPDETIHTRVIHINSINHNIIQRTTTWTVAGENAASIDRGVAVSRKGLLACSEHSLVSVCTHTVA